MAAQNLTASALTFVQDRVEAMYAPNQSTPHKYPFVPHVSTARAMLSEHVANVSPVTDAQNNCVGHRIYWLKKGTDTVAYNSTPGSYTFNCVIPSGQGPVSNTKTYSNNYAIVSRIEVDDDLCGNVFRNPGADSSQEAATLIQNRFAAGMKDIADKVNAKFVTFLDTNKSAVNNDPSLPSGISFGSSTFTVNEALWSMQEPDTLTELDAIAMNNDMMSYFYVAGRRHFYNAKVDAAFRVQNDAERDHIRLLDGGDWRMYHDIKNIDSTLSGNNSFIVDPGSYAFWDFVNNGRSRDPQLIEHKNGETYEYWVEHPFLNFAGRPLRINVRYQKTCNGGNTTQMKTTFTHRWELILHGGLYTAPASEDNHTGILKFKSA